MLFVNMVRDGAGCSSSVRAVLNSLEQCMILHEVGSVGSAKRTVSGRLLHPVRDFCIELKSAQLFRRICEFLESVQFLKHPASGFIPRTLAQALWPLVRTGHVQVMTQHTNDAAPTWRLELCGLHGFAQDHTYTQLTLCFTFGKPGQVRRGHVIGASFSQHRRCAWNISTESSTWPKLPTSLPGARGNFREMSKKAKTW